MDATSTASEIERLRRADFDTMTADELVQVKRLVARVRLPIPDIGTRRMRPDSNGERLDPRATLRASLRGSADAIVLRRRSRVRRHSPLVVLCDVSGSMGRYARMFLQFLHDTFWGSQAAAAGTGLLLAMAACIWAMNLGNASALRLFRQRAAQEATGAAAQITATNLHIISALLLGTNSLLAGILCALLFGGMP